MKTNAEKIVMLDTLTAELAERLGPKISAVDYEIQDGFKCVLIRARVDGAHFVVSDTSESGIMNLLSQLDENRISWVVAFLDKSGKVLDALNGDKQ